MYMHVNVVVTIAATFLVVSGLNFASDTDDLIYEINSIVDEELSNCELIQTGLGVAVIAKNNIGNGFRNFTYFKGFGYKDIENEIPVTDDTIFCIGSITKHFTATLLVHLLDLLQQKGERYNLQTLATELDPTLNFPGSNYIGVTLEDVLSHLTGVAEVFGNFHVGYPKNTTRKHLAWIAANLPRIAKNREKYEYNNHVFASAGHFAEILAEKLLKRVVSWEQLMYLYLLNPLGIQGDVDLAGYGFKSDARVALAYMLEKGHYKLLDSRTLGLIEPAGPAGSLCLTPKAMAVWMQFQLDRGHFGSKQIIAKKSLEDTWKARIRTREDPPAHPTQNLGNKTFTMADYSKELAETTGYALGWGESTLRGYRLISHSGGITSYASQYAMFPDLNISIFTSSAGPSTELVVYAMARIQYRVFDFLMQLAPFDQSDNVCLNKPAAQNVSNPSQSTDANTPNENVQVVPKFYVGTFRNPFHGTIVIRHARPSGMYLLAGRYGNATILCTKSPAECSLDFHGILWYLSAADSYEAPTEVPMINFNFTQSGYVSHLSMPLFSSEYPPIFEKVSMG